MRAAVLRWTLIFGLIPAASAAAEPAVPARPKVPEYRIEPDGFDARQEDLRRCWTRRPASCGGTFPTRRSSPSW